MSESGLSIETMRRIYHTKCRELPMKMNFPSAYTNNFCLFPTCMEKDSQNHIFESKCFSPENEIIETNINYADIFSNDVIAQVRVIKILFSRLDIRSKYITLSGQ